MSGLTTVFRKEVRENIRDRRALFNSLLLGPLLFPLLFVGMMWFLAYKLEMSTNIKTEFDALKHDIYEEEPVVAEGSSRGQSGV